MNETSSNNRQGSGKHSAFWLRRVAFILGVALVAAVGEGVWRSILFSLPPDMPSFQVFIDGMIDVVIPFMVRTSFWLHVLFLAVLNMILSGSKWWQPLEYKGSVRWTMGVAYGVVMFGLIYWSLNDPQVERQMVGLWSFLATVVNGVMTVFLFTILHAWLVGHPVKVVPPTSFKGNGEAGHEQHQQHKPRTSQGVDTTSSHAPGASFEDEETTKRVVTRRPKGEEPS